MGHTYVRFGYITTSTSSPGQSERLPIATFACPITFRSCRRGALWAPCFTGARAASGGGNSPCYMEWAALKPDYTRRRTVSCVPRVGGDPPTLLREGGRGWAGDEVRRP